MDINDIDNKWSLYSRNVIDQYKDLTNEEIKTDLKNKAFPFAVLMTQLQGDFNFATVVRSANAFGVRECFYYNSKKHIDRRGMMGVYHYTDVNYLKSMEDIKQLKDKYCFVGIEQTANSIPLNKFGWNIDRPILLILGEESCGLNEEMLSLCDYTIEINQFGSVRSLNAGVAASVVMWDLLSKKFIK